MSAAVFIILCWIGFRTFNVENELETVSKTVFEAMLKNDRPGKY